MIIVDVRPYGKELTLEKCVEQVERLEGNDPDEFWISEWQSKNIFSSARLGPFVSYRGIPLKVIVKEEI